MIRTILAVAAALAVSSAASAEPLKLTDSQMDKVTAGTGRDNVTQTNPSPQSPWDELSGNGFAPTAISPGKSGISVTVPRRP